MNDNRFDYYIYVLLDPRKPGKYNYSSLGISFLYEPFYVGKGRDNRMYAHFYPTRLKEKSYKNYKLNNILTKYNRTEYKKYIIKIEIELDENLAFAKECCYIDKIGRYNLKKGPLTNMSDGGNQPPSCKGRVFSEEHRKNISKAKLGIKLSEETKKKMSVAHSGSNNYNYGRVHTAESRRKMSEANKGKKISDENKRKIKERTIGMNNPSAKIWFLIDPSGNIIGPIFDCARFCKDNNINHCKISNVAHGTRTHTNKWKVFKVYTKQEWQEYNISSVGEN